MKRELRCRAFSTKSLIKNKNEPENYQLGLSATKNPVASVSAKIFLHYVIFIKSITIWMVSFCRLELLTKPLAYNMSTNSILSSSYANK